MVKKIIRSKSESKNKSKSKKSKRTRKKVSLYRKTRTRKTRTRKTRTNKKIKKGTKINIFRKESRLTKEQRKYCNCLMKVRKSTYDRKYDGNMHYYICRRGIIGRLMKDRKINQKEAEKRLNIRINCGLNYNLTEFDIEELRAYAKELGVAIYRKLKSGKIKMTPKHTLVRNIYNKVLNNNIKRSKDKSKSTPNIIKPVSLPKGWVKKNVILRKKTKKKD